jgi:phytochelatin synthase
MKRTLSIAAITLVVAFVAGMIFLIPPTVPPEVIERSVIHEQTLLEKSWLLPTASAFGHYVAYQSNQSLCGPASIANILRSFGEPADTEKKVLAHTTKCWSGICFFGLSLDELADVTRTATKRSVTVLRDLTPEAFRDELTHVNDPSRRYVINFARAPIFGSGVGHHSPIGGYLEAEDLVLVLDVNEKFKPWLVERSRLYDAMNTLDGDKKRGLLTIE